MLKKLISALCVSTLLFTSISVNASSFPTNSNTITPYLLETVTTKYCNAQSTALVKVSNISMTNATITVKVFDGCFSKSNYNSIYYLSIKSGITKWTNNAANCSIIAEDAPFAYSNGIKQRIQVQGNSASIASTSTLTKSQATTLLNNTGVEFKIKGVKVTNTTELNKVWGTETSQSVTVILTSSYTSWYELNTTPNSFGSITTKLW